MYHHTQGVWLCQEVFGRTIDVQRVLGTIVAVPVRLIAEQHVIEDLGWLPSPKDYIDAMAIRPWMSGARLREQALSELGLTAPPSNLTQHDPANLSPVHHNQDERR